MLWRFFCIQKIFWSNLFASVREFSNWDKSDFPDLYLFDVMLTDGSGIELCEEIRNHDRSESIPVIIMCAHAKLEDVKQICEPDDLIVKHFEIDDLLKRIKKILYS